MRRRKARPLFRRKAFLRGQGSCPRGRSGRRRRAVRCGGPGSLRRHIGRAPGTLGPRPARKAPRARTRRNPRWRSSCSTLRGNRPRPRDRGRRNMPCRSRKRESLADPLSNRRKTYTRSDEGSMRGRRSSDGRKREGRYAASPGETDERAGAKGSPPQEARQKRATPLTINGFRPGSFMPGL